MSRKPRPSRPATRSAEPVADTVASRPLFHRFAKGQRDLFRPEPIFIPPCKPVLRSKLPAGPHWQYEVKHDGYRLQAHAVGDHVRLFSKSGRDYTDRLPAIREAVAALRRDLILDGEAVMCAADGTSDFFALHAAVADKWAPHAFLVAFDLLSVDGVDLRERPLSERHTMLTEMLAGAGPDLEISQPLDGTPAAIWRNTCAHGLEGVVAKRRDRPYRSGDRDEWVKVKCTTVEAFAVIGFDPAGRKGVASLKLARLDNGGQLRACGSVGSGIGEAASRELRAALDTREPVVVDVEHRGVTPAGELRHPVFKGCHTA